MFVCLAAGRGKRMEPLSRYLHKAMIPFFGVPFLAYSLLSIPENSKVVIIVNYFKDQIYNYFGASYKGRTIQYLTQKNPKGTGDALFQFSRTFRPKSPVIIWQADQMILPNEIDILSTVEPNAGMYSHTPMGCLDLGFWKIKPETLTKLKSGFDGTEYRALPVLEKEGLKQIRIPRRKLEISHDSWEQIIIQCKFLKQKFHIESH